MKTAQLPEASECHEGHRRSLKLWLPITDPTEQGWQILCCLDPHRQPSQSCVCHTCSCPRCPMDQILSPAQLLGSPLTAASNPMDYGCARHSLGKACHSTAITSTDRGIPEIQAPGRLQAPCVGQQFCDAWHVLLFFTLCSLRCCMGSHGEGYMLSLSSVLTCAGSTCPRLGNKEGSGGLCTPTPEAVPMLGRAGSRGLQDECTVAQL